MGYYSGEQPDEGNESAYVLSCSHSFEYVGKIPGNINKEQIKRSLLFPHRVKPSVFISDNGKHFFQHF